jgi:predicted O-linked N-acetylglucosamine transferase (SPINDLY family)
MNRKQRRRATKLGQKANNSVVKQAEVVPVDGAELLATGREHHQAGRLAEAEACYRRVPAGQSGHADALHLLGMIAQQRGRHDLAIDQINQAIKHYEHNAAYFCSLGISLYQQGKRDEAVVAYRRAIRIKPDFANAYSNLAGVLRDEGKIDEAITAYRQALGIKPDLAEAHFNLGNALSDRREVDGAVASYRQAIHFKPSLAEAYFCLANALRAQGKYDEVLATFDSALILHPNNVEALNARGVILHQLKRFDEALGSYDRALAIRSDYAEAFNNRGVTLQELKRFDEALTSYDRALMLRLDSPDTLYNRGVTLNELKRYEEAVASYDRALTLHPGSADALNNRGITLQRLHRNNEAIVSYDRALALDPEHVDALKNRGIGLQRLNRHDEALVSYDRSLVIEAKHADTLNNRGIALQRLKRHEEAFASYTRALELEPGHADALHNLGNLLRERHRFADALASYERALDVKPDHPHAFSGAADSAMKLCDWERRRLFAEQIKAHVSAKKSMVDPFVFLGYSGDPALQLECANHYVENTISAGAPLVYSGRYHDRLRIAYISSDFRSHPMAHSIVGLIEQHDHFRFEIFGISFGDDDGSEIRKRLVAGFEHFHDVRSMGDEEVAKLLYDLQIDIAIDLNGHTRNARPGIFARRPAPIQVSYQGFPGTTGANFIDYVIADTVVLPLEDQKFFTEKAVYLPDCYQVNDSKRRIAERTPFRRDLGLPEHGFVFCCFNNNWKITPTIFDVWMRLLHQVGGSVLWLLKDNEIAERNLCNEAQRRGIDSSRLVFAGRLPHPEHLARHRLAHLFVDTLPYNAHMTASDALWAGLPVVSCVGEAFAGRVGASLLHATGVPELITSNLQDYEALALRLARDPDQLMEIKARLLDHRDTCALFDTTRFARHLEAAYTKMWETWRRGEMPRSFSVQPFEAAASVVL